MTFDLFGFGKYCYTFESRCREVPELRLEDKAVRIFLSTKGKNDNEVSKELVAFLHYLEDTTDDKANQYESERIRRIHKRVCEIKKSEEVGIRYMQAWEEKYYEREEGREEVLRLYDLLVRDNREDDLKNSLKDAEFLKKLMKEYKIVKE